MNTKGLSNQTFLPDGTLYEEKISQLEKNLANKAYGYTRIMYQITTGKGNKTK